MQARFAAGSFCVVADCGMISQRTIEALDRSSTPQKTK